MGDRGRELWVRGNVDFISGGARGVSAETSFEYLLSMIWRLAE